MSASKRKVKVMVFGVFDLLHPGHLSFLKQARDLGDELVVSIARDINVKRNKGLLPVFHERERREAVAAIIIVDKVVLGGVSDAWAHIVQEQPDIIALGYDQEIYVSRGGLKKFQEELVKHNLKTKVVRLKAYRPEKFKTKKIKQQIKNGKEI